MTSVEWRKFSAAENLWQKMTKKSKHIFSLRKTPKWGGSNYLQGGKPGWVESRIGRIAVSSINKHSDTQMPQNTLQREMTIHLLSQQETNDLNSRDYDIRNYT